MTRQRTALPSFREDREIRPYDMRQLVAALEYRLQSLEDNNASIFPDQTDELDNRYAQIGHTHTESEISDLAHTTSIFTLTDVSGSYDIGDGIVWNGTTFEPGEVGAASLALNDITDVSAPVPSDNDVIQYDSGTGLWTSQQFEVIDTLFELLDTDIASQLQGDLLYNNDGTEWQATGQNFQWFPGQYVQLGPSIGVNWYNESYASIELLNFTPVIVAGLGTLCYGVDVAADPLWDDVVCLLPFEGTDGATTADDESATNATLTFVADAQIDTAQFACGNSSVLLDGTGDYVSLPANNALYEITGVTGEERDTCVEFFFRWDGVGTGGTIIQYAADAATSRPNWLFSITAASKIQFKLAHIQTVDATGFDVHTLLSTTTIVADTWYHVAGTYDASVGAGGGAYLYMDGVQEDSDEVTGNPPRTENTDLELMVGWYKGSGTYYGGHVDGVRITQNQLRYTGNFTPPSTIEGTQDQFFVGDPAYHTEIDGTAIGLKNNIGINWDNSSGNDVELANFIPSVGGDEFISQTALLLHFDIADGEMTFKDSSGNENHGRLMGWNSTLSRISSAQSQFGGSSFFVEDASGSHLCVDHSSPELDFGSNDFTIEWWNRPNQTTIDEAIMVTLESSNGTWAIWRGPTNLTQFTIRDGTTTKDHETHWPSGDVIGVWKHKAIVRSGDQISYYVDGVAQTPSLGDGSLSAGYSIVQDNNPIRIGDYNSPLGTAFTYDGYLDEIRITNGVARYTSNFTPPTAQFADGPSDNTDPFFASVTGMYNFDGVDAATTFTNTGSGPNPTFLGDAALSDTHTIQGTTSLYVSGNNDSCVVLDSGNDGIDDFGTGDFTVEFWFRGDTPINDTTIIARGRDVGNDSGFAYKVRYSSNGNSVTLQVGDGTTIYSLPLDVGNPTTPGTRTQQWQHIALVRSGDDLYGFREGVRDLTGWSGTPSAGWSVPYDTSEKTVVGASWNGTGYQTECKGYVKNLRITKGVARYTADFRPDPLYGDSVVIAGEFDDSFYLGDPDYLTRIDGSETTINNGGGTQLARFYDTTTGSIPTAQFPHAIAGDPGTEDDGISVNDTQYESVLKVSDLGGTNEALMHLHRHSDTLTPILIASRSRGNTSAHSDVLDNDLLLSIIAAGWNTDTYNISSEIRFEVDGTPSATAMPGQITFQTAPAGTRSGLDRMRIRADGSVEFVDPGGTDWAAFSHDGTNFNTALTNTTSWEVSGANDLRLTGGMDLFLLDAGLFRVYDTDNSHYTQFAHENADLLVTAVGASPRFRFQDYTQINIEDGMSLVMFGAATGTATFNHDNTDFNTTFAATTDWNVTGLVGGTMILDGSLTVDEDLTVSGTVTSLNTGDVNIADNIIVLNSNVTGAPTLNAGIEIERGTSANVLVRWNETDDRWEFTNDGSTYYQFMEMADGTATDNTLRWDGSNWVESTLLKLNDPGGNHSLTSVLDEATGDEVAFALNYTTNKLTSGADTGFVINKTDTASPGTSLLADWQVGGVTKFSWTDNPTMSIIGASAGIQLQETGAAVNEGNWILVADSDELYLAGATDASPGIRATDILSIFRTGTTSNLIRWETLATEFRSGGAVRVLDAANVQQLNITVSGNTAALESTGVNDIQLQPTGGEQGVTINANGSVELYHDNVKRVETGASGYAAILSDGNTDTEVRQLALEHQDGTRRASFGYGAGAAALDIRNEIHGAPVQIYSEDAVGTPQLILSGDPDSTTELRATTNLTLSVAGGETALVATANAAVAIYYDNAEIITTRSYGVAVNGATNNDPTLGGTQDARVYFENTSGARVGYTGFLGSSDIYLGSDVYGGDVRITGIDGAGASRTMAIFRPDNQVALAYDNATVFTTIADGIQVQNSLSSGDNAQFTHDGTDFNTTFALTTDWNISGITAIQAGTVDADFDAITATSYGGILEANLLDKTANETITGLWDFSDLFQLTNSMVDYTDATLELRSGNPGLVFYETDQALDEKLWALQASGSGFLAYIAEDAGGNINRTKWMDVQRTGYAAVDSIEFIADAITLTGAVTATSYDGVLAANLLDKTATETVSGAYDFTAQPNFALGATVGNNDPIEFKNSSALTDGTQIYRATGNALRLHYDLNALVIQGLGDHAVSIRDSSDTATITLQTVDGHIIAKTQDLWVSGGTAQDCLHLRDTTDATDVVWRYDGVNWTLRNEGGGAGDLLMRFVQSGGSVENYYSSFLRTSTKADSMYVHSDDNLDTSTRSVRFVHQDGTNRAFFGHNVSANFLWRNQIHGGDILIEAEDAVGTVRTILTGDPDGISSLRGDTDVRLQNNAGNNAFYGVGGGESRIYHNNVITLNTGVGVLDFKSVGNTDTENRYIRWEHQDGTRRAYMGHAGSGTLQIKNEIHGAAIAINAEDIGGTSRTILNADPDAVTFLRGDTGVTIELTPSAEIAIDCIANADVRLYYNNNQKFNTKSNGVGVTGGLFIDERAAAPTNEATRGILWVKNTVPCQLWFTDDAGTDTQIV